MDLMSIRRGLLMMLVEGGTSDMELIKTYTVPESWETDAKGNPVSIMNALLPSEEKSLFDYSDFVVCVVENNTNTSNYACKWLISAARDNYGVYLRGTSQYRSFSSNNSCYISSGATIKVYKANVYDIQ